MVDELLEELVEPVEVEEVPEFVLLHETLAYDVLSPLVVQVVPAVPPRQDEAFPGTGHDVRGGLRRTGRTGSR